MFWAQRRCDAFYLYDNCCVRQNISWLFFFSFFLFSYSLQMQRFFFFLDLACRLFSRENSLHFGIARGRFLPFKNCQSADVFPCKPPALLRKSRWIKKCDQRRRGRGGREEKTKWILEFSKLNCWSEMEWI